MSRHKQLRLLWGEILGFVAAFPHLADAFIEQMIQLIQAMRKELDR